ELVSPGDAGAILMLPSDSIAGASLNSGCAGAGCKSRSASLYPVNTGLATNPPRFAYWGGFGAFVEHDATNSVMGMYVATRTPTGWTTTLPGLKGKEGLIAGRPRCSDDLSLCTDHNEGDTIYAYPAQIEAAAALFNVNGNRIASLPTNVDAVPEARY